MYDNLNRLEKYGNPYKVYDTIAYSTSGNILSKTGAGTFGYSHPGRPYQISDREDFPETADTALLTVSYTSGRRPLTISKSGNTASFAYNHAGERTKMAVTGTSANYTRTYLGGNYERDVKGSVTTERLYLGGTPYDAPAVAIRTGGEAWQLHYIHRDYLGSIVAVSNASGAAVENRSYDAWGRLRHPATLQPYAHDAQPALFLRRGYTGHEHLPEFGLINMNARLYDPVVGRFLSPDPYVQMPDFSQSFNRYSYAWNNPLIYTDPDGEFLWTFLTSIFDFIGTAFFKGGLDPTSSTARQNAWQNYDPTASWSNTNKAWQIDMGLFRTDPNKNFWGRTWEFISRHTWQAPQTMLGYVGSGVQNLFGGVRSVTHYGGATAVEMYGSDWGAVTFGSYIMGERDLTADPNNSLFQHEYGHYIQSQRAGLDYLVSHGIPSLISVAKDKDGYDHDDFWTEQDANKQAYEYFYSKMDGDWKWHFRDNPINDVNWLNAVHGKYSIYSPMNTGSGIPNYNWEFSGGNTWQGIDNDYLYGKYHKRPSVKSLKELLLLYKR